MGVSHFLSSICCELRILQAKNMETKRHGNFFIRYYLPAGNNKRIQLNSQEISSKSSDLIIWKESFCFECSGTEESVNNLKQQTVVFELRWRSNMPVFGKIMGKSKLLERAEMPWKAVFEKSNMGIEKYWVTLVSTNDRVLESLKPPSIQISMKLVRGPEMVEMEKQKKKKKKKKKKKRKERLMKNNCGCKYIGGGCNCADYEIFALSAALEGL